MLSLVVAASENNVIGRRNALPWNLPDDLKRFRTLTEQHPVIMGRKSHEAIGRPLPNRRNIVITRQKQYQAEGCTVVSSLAEAIQEAGDHDETFVIGGGEIFREALPLADRIYLTRVHTDIEGDAFLPTFDVSEWKLVSETRHEADPKHQYDFTFQTWERKR